MVNVKTITQFRKKSKENLIGKIEHSCRIFRLSWFQLIQLLEKSADQNRQEQNSTTRNCKRNVTWFAKLSLIKFLYWAFVYTNPLPYQFLEIHFLSLVVVRTKLLFWWTLRENLFLCKSNLSKYLPYGKQNCSRIAGKDLPSWRQAFQIVEVSFAGPGFGS